MMVSDLRHFDFQALIGELVALLRYPAKLLHDPAADGSAYA